MRLTDKPLHLRRLLLGTSALTGFALASTAQAGQAALPTNGVVTVGSATIAQPNANQLNITTATSRTVIDWQSFSIGNGNKVAIQQPGSSSITVNEVTGSDPSQIFGDLSSNGRVVLANPNGIWFGPNSHVDVAGLVASTATLSADAKKVFAAGGRLSLDTAGNPTASIQNDGHITIASEGLAALVAPGVRNNGVIEATLGSVTLASGETSTLDFYGDGLVSLAVTSPVQALAIGPDGKPFQATIENKGKIAAQHVLITADVVKGVVDNSINMSGVVEAKGVTVSGGDIVLDGGDGAVTVAGTLDATSQQAQGGNIAVTGGAVTLAATAKLDASGAKGGGTVQVGGGPHGGGTLKHAKTVLVQGGSAILANATQQGDGGTVSVWSDGQTTFNGSIEAKGAGVGGNGGWVETSGHDLGITLGHVDASSPHGKAGTWLLDPYNLDIIAGGSGTNTASTFSSSAGVSTVNDSDINASLNAGIDVLVNVGGSSGQPGNITLDTGAALTWSTSNHLTLDATSNGGTGNIVLQGTISGPNGVLTLVSSGTISQIQPIQVRALELLGGGQAMLGAITNDVGTLAANTGAVSLNNGGNNLVIATAGTTTGITLVGDFVISDAGTVTLASNVADSGTGSVDLSSVSELLIQNSPTIDTSSGTGAITLSTVDDTTAGADKLVLKSGGNIMLGGTIGGTNVLNSLTAHTNTGGSLTINDPVSASGLGGISLEADGTISTAAGATLTATAGAVQIISAENDIQIGAGIYSALGTGIYGNNAHTGASGNVTINAPILDSGTTPSNLTNGLGIEIVANTGTISTNASGSLTTARSLRLQNYNSGDITLTGTISANAATIHASGNLTLNAAVSTTAGTAAQGIYLTSDTGAFSNSGVLTTAGTLTISAPLGITIGDPIQDAGGTVVLNSNGTVTSPFGITADDLALTGTQGTFNLDASTNNVGIIAAVGNSLTFDNGTNSLTIGTVGATAGITLAGDITLQFVNVLTLASDIRVGGSGGIDLTPASGGVVLANSVTLDSTYHSGTGTIALPQVDAATAGAYSLMLKSGGGITLNGPIGSSGALSSLYANAGGTGGTLAVDAPVRVSGLAGIVLNANTTITTAAGATLTAANGVVKASSNSVTTGAAISSGLGTGLYASDGGITVGGTILDTGTGASSLTSSALGIVLHADRGTISTGSGDLLTTARSLHVYNTSLDANITLNGTVTANAETIHAIGGIYLTAPVIATVGSVSPAITLIADDHGVTTNGLTASGTISVSAGNSTNGTISIGGTVDAPSGLVILQSNSSVNQTAPIDAQYLELLGGGNLTLTNTLNNIGTLAANAGGLNLNNGGHSLAIGQAGTTTGITLSGGLTISNVDILTLGSGTFSNLSIAASGSGIDLSGVTEVLVGSQTTTISTSGGTNPGIAIGRIDDANAAGTDSLALQSAYSVILIGNVGGTRALAAFIAESGGTSAITLDVAINAHSTTLHAGGNLSVNNSLSASGGIYLTSDTGTVSNLGSLDSFGTISISAPLGITLDGGQIVDASGTVVLNSTGTVTQSPAAAITAAAVVLTGAGGYFNLGTAANNVATMAANTGSVRFNGGANNLTIGTVGNTAGITLSGDLYFHSVNVLTLASDIRAGGSGGIDLASGAQAITLANSVTIDNSGGIGGITLPRVDGTSAGGQSLTLNSGGGVTLNGTIGITTPLYSLNVTSNNGGVISLPSYIYTRHGQTFTGPVVVSQPGVTTLRNIGASITFTDTVDGATGNETLSLNAGEGGSNFTFEGAVAGGNGLAELDISTFGATTFASSLGGGTQGLGVLMVQSHTIFLGGNISTTGAQTFSGAVTLTNDVAITSANAGIIFGSTIDSDTVTARSISITSPDTVEIDDDVGDSQPLNAFTVTASALVGANSGPPPAINAASISYPGYTMGGGGGNTLQSNYSGDTDLNLNYTLTSDMTVTVTGGNLTIDGTIDGPYNLTISDAGHILTITGAIGGSTALASLTVSAGAITLGSSTIKTTGGQDYQAAITLSAATALTTTAGGLIRFESTVDGAQALTINASGGTVELDSQVGYNTPLSSFSLTAAKIALAADIRTTGALTLAGDLVLGADVNLTSTGGTVSLQKISGAQFITVDADTVDLTGNIGDTATMLADGSAEVPLNQLSVTASQINFGGTGPLVITTKNTQAYTGQVMLVTDTTLTSTTGGFSFPDTIDGAHALSLSATNGDVSLQGDIGSTTPLTAFSVTANTINGHGAPFNGPPAIILADSAMPDITFTSMSLLSAYMSGADLTGHYSFSSDITVTVTGGSFTLESGATIDGSGKLTIVDAGSTITINGIIGGSSQPSSVTLAAAHVAIAGSVTSTGAFAAHIAAGGDFTLGTGGTITTTGAGGTVSIAPDSTYSLNGTKAPAETYYGAGLNITIAGTVNSSGGVYVKATDQAVAVTTPGTITVSGTIMNNEATAVTGLVPYTSGSAATADLVLYAGVGGTLTLAPGMELASPNAGNIALVADTLVVGDPIADIVTFVPTGGSMNPPGTVIVAPASTKGALNGGTAYNDFQHGSASGNASILSADLFTGTESSISVISGQGETASTVGNVFTITEGVVEALSLNNIGNPGSAAVGQLGIGLAGMLTSTAIGDGAGTFSLPTNTWISGNAVTVAGPISVAGNLTLNASSQSGQGGIMIDASIQAGSLAVYSYRYSNITVSAPVTTTGTLTANTYGAFVTNGNGTLMAGGGLAISANSGITLGVLAHSDAGIQLTSNGGDGFGGYVTVNAPVTAQDANVQANSGTISVTGPIATTGSLTLSAYNGISLSNAGTLNAGGALSIDGSLGVTIGAAVHSDTSVTVNSSGGDGGGGGITVGARVTSPGTIALSATYGPVSISNGGTLAVVNGSAPGMQGIYIASEGSVTVAAGALVSTGAIFKVGAPGIESPLPQGIEIDGTVNAGWFDLRNGGGTITIPGTLVSTVASASDISSTTAPINISGTVTSAGDLAISSNSGNITIPGQVSNAGTLAISSSGTISLAGTATAATFDISDENGSNAPIIIGGTLTATATGTMASTIDGQLSPIVISGNVSGVGPVLVTGGANDSPTETITITSTGTVASSAYYVLIGARSGDQTSVTIAGTVAGQGVTIASGGPTATFPNPGLGVTIASTAVIRNTEATSQNIASSADLTIFTAPGGTLVFDEGATVTAAAGNIAFITDNFELNTPSAVSTISTPGSLIFSPSRTQGTFTASGMILTGTQEYPMSPISFTVGGGTLPQPLLGFLAGSGSGPGANAGTIGSLQIGLPGTGNTISIANSTSFAKPTTIYGGSISNAGAITAVSDLTLTAEGSVTLVAAPVTVGGLFEANVGSGQTFSLAAGGSITAGTGAIIADQGSNTLIDISGTISAPEILLLASDHQGGTGGTITLESGSLIVNTATAANTAPYMADTIFYTGPGGTLNIEIDSKVEGGLANVAFVADTINVPGSGTSNAGTPSTISTTGRVILSPASTDGLLQAGLAIPDPFTDAPYGPTTLLNFAVPGGGSVEHIGIGTAFGGEFAVDQTAINLFSGSGGTLVGKLQVGLPGSSTDIYFRGATNLPSEAAFYAGGIYLQSDVVLTNGGTSSFEGSSAPSRITFVATEQPNGGGANIDFEQGSTITSIGVVQAEGYCALASCSGARATATFDGKITAPQILYYSAADEGNGPSGDTVTVTSNAILTATGAPTGPSGGGILFETGRGGSLAIQTGASLVDSGGAGIAFLTDALNVSGGATITTGSLLLDTGTTAINNQGTAASGLTITLGGTAAAGTGLFVSATDVVDLTSDLSPTAVLSIGSQADVPEAVVIQGTVTVPQPTLDLFASGVGGTGTLNAGSILVTSTGTFALGANLNLSGSFTEGIGNGASFTQSAGSSLTAGGGVAIYADDASGGAAISVGGTITGPDIYLLASDPNTAAGGTVNLTGTLVNDHASYSGINAANVADTILFAGVGGSINLYLGSAIEGGAANVALVADGLRLLGSTGALPEISTSGTVIVSPATTDGTLKGGTLAIPSSAGGNFLIDGAVPGGPAPLATIGVGAVPNQAFALYNALMSAVSGGATPVGELQIGLDGASSPLAFTGATTLSAPTVFYGGAATLVGDTSITANTNILTLPGRVDGAFALTVDAPTGIVALDGAVGGTTPLASLSITAGSIALPASVTTSGGQSFAGATTLVADTTLTAGGTIGLSGTVDGTGTQSLTLAGGAVALSGVIGGAPSGTATLLQFTDGAATVLTGDTTIHTAGSILITGSVNGAHALALDDGAQMPATVTITGGIGTTTALASLAVVANDGITVGGAINTTGDQSYNAAVTLVADTTFSAATGGIGFGSTIDGAHALSVAAGGPVSFGGAIGSIIPVSSFALAAGSLPNGFPSVASAGGFAANLGDATLSGDYNFTSFSDNGTLTLTGDTEITTVGALSISGTVDGAHALTLDAGTVASLTGTIGGTVALTSLTVTGGSGIALGGAVTTSGGQTYENALTLANSALLTSSGAVAFVGTVNGGFALAIDAGSVSLGTAGSTTALGSLTIDATTATLGSVTTTNEQSYSAATTLGGNYAASGFAVSGPTLLSTDTVVSTGTGGIRFGGTVDGDQALALNDASGSVTLAGAAGSVTPLGLLTINAANISVGSVTTVHGQVFNGATQFDGSYVASSFSASGADTLMGATSVTVTAGNLGFAGTVDGGQALTLNDASGSVTLAGAAGSVTPLGSLTINAANISVGSVVTTHAQVFNGATQFDGTYSGSSFSASGSDMLMGSTSVTATAGNLGFAGTVDGSQSLTLSNMSGTVTLGGMVGATTPLDSLTVSGSTVTANSVTTTGGQTYTGAATLSGNFTAGSFTANGADTLAGATSVTATSGNVAFGGSIDGAQSLTLAATSGSVTVAGAVGGKTALSSLTLGGAGDAVTFTGSVATAALTDTRSSGSLTVAGGLTAATYVASSSNDVLISISGGTGPLSLAGEFDFTTALDLSGRALTLTGATVLDTSANNKSLTLGTVDGAYALTLNAGTAAVALKGAAGAQTALASLTINGGSISLGNVTTTGAQTYNGATTFNGTYIGSSFSANGTDLLGGATGVTATAGNISFSNTIDGGQALSLTDVSGIVTLGGTVGGKTDLGSLTITAAGIVASNVTTTGAQSYGGALTLASSSTIQSVNSDLTFGSTINGTQSLILSAGGNIVFDGTLASQANPTALSVLTADNVTVLNNSTLWVTTFKGFATGTFTFGNHSLESDDVVTIQASSVDGRVVSSSATLNVNTATGIITGDTVSVTATGAVSEQITAGAATVSDGSFSGSVQATRSANIASTGDTSGTVTVSGGSATVSGTNVSGSVTASGLAQISASENVSADVTGGAVTINAGGLVNGAITSTAAGGVTINAANVNSTIVAQNNGSVDVTASGSISGSVTGGAVTLTAPVVTETINAQSATINSADANITGTIGGTDATVALNGGASNITQEILGATQQIASNGAGEGGGDTGEDESDDEKKKKKAAKDKGAVYDYANQYIDNLIGGKPAH